MRINSLEDFFAYADGKPPLPTHMWVSAENGDRVTSRGETLYYLRAYDIFFTAEEITGIFAKDEKCLGYYSDNRKN